jgi:hypothetical protein
MSLYDEVEGISSFETPEWTSYAIQYKNTRDHHLPNTHHENVETHTALWFEYKLGTWQSSCFFKEMQTMITLYELFIRFWWSL